MGVLAGFSSRGLVVGGASPGTFPRREGFIGVNVPLPASFNHLRLR
jgi:hypothetical protein